MEYYFDGEATWQLALYPDQRIKLSHLQVTGEAVLGWRSGNLNTCLFDGPEPPDSTTYLISPFLGDLQPPTVEVSTHGDVEVGELAAYPVTATVADSSGLAEVWLIWEDSDSARDSVAMALAGDTWLAEIPAPAPAPGWIRYHVRAVDDSWHPNTRITDRLMFLVQERAAVSHVYATSGRHDRIELDWSLLAGWETPQTLLADFECGLPVASAEFVGLEVLFAFKPSLWSDEQELADDFVFLDEVRFENLVPVAPRQERAIASYSVLRDGQLVAENLPERRWADTTPATGDSASYQVQAIFDSGAGPLSDPVTGRVADWPLAGPGDLSGYRWTHGDAPDGPVWEWLDMSQAGSVGFNSQGLSAPRELGFEFMYFGTPRQSVRVLNSGGLTFSDSGCLVEWMLPMPAAPFPDDWIAALFNHQRTFSVKTLELPAETGWVAEFSLAEVPLVQVCLTPAGAIR